VALSVDLADFPAVVDLTYLNTGSVGLVPKSIVEKVQEFDRMLALNGTTKFDEETELAVLEGTRCAGARLFGVDPENVALATSFTEAMSQIAWWARPGRGTNVVSTDVDFPSVTYPWHRVASEFGCQVRLAPVLRDPEALDIEMLANLVDENTQVISISHVQYLTGHLLDVRALADLAHSHGALLVLDTTQSAGQVSLDATDWGVDVMIAGSYKWLCSTFGSAICYLAPSVLERFEPPFVGWRSTTDPWSLDARYLPLAHSARRMEYSTMPYGAGLALGSAIDYLMDIGIDEIREHNLALTGQLIAGLDERGAHLLTPRPRDQRAGIVTARFEGLDGEQIAADLTARGVIVSPRVGSFRFSPHFYNTPADIEVALETLDAVLESHREQHLTA
jgi:cysteine desulfurase / selenocysteine lyase